MTTAVIRPARPADLSDVIEVVTAAFGQPDEARLVARLVEDDDAVISLVASLDGHVCGHVMVSPITLDPEPSPALRCLGIAPLSVSPASQSQGLGSQLMREVIRLAREQGADALFLLGNPDYYRRFGFQRSTVGNDYGAGAAFQSLELTPGSLGDVRATAHYARAFSALEGGN